MQSLDQTFDLEDCNENIEDDDGTSININWTHFNQTCEYSNETLVGEEQENIRFDQE
jgi:hypothetical protein